jgi:hypothetical protein
MTDEQKALKIQLVQLLHEDFPVLNLVVKYILTALFRLGPQFKDELLAVLEADSPTNGEQAFVHSRARDFIKGLFP